MNRIILAIPVFLLSCLYIPKSNPNIEKKYFLPEKYKQKIGYVYLPKVCGTYDSSLDFRTNENAINEYIFAKAKKADSDFNPSKLDNSSVKVYIKVYRRYACIGDYNYKNYELYEDLWSYLSGMSLGLVPFYGNARAIVEYQLFIEGKLIRKYEYLTRTTEIGSILLLPFFWINFVNGDFREDYLETFLQFQDELAKELNLAEMP
ncbi:hypothetical protein [Leptospira kanakyensis]|uniref:hypothetical protein n=1 Tax=Leptospira kanakyensis TaxID=2484968 RepID=UPI00223D5526|nr:hypothetical protein [Leptospira kanakyensis]MCW7470523.1 hypothetical protein [Leptospira kanakyensis]MCW7481613.1 hypothetical protein [Leptospira kanakyensis]